MTPQTHPTTTTATDRTEAVRALARAARLLERSSGDLSVAHYRILAAVAGGDERASRVAVRLALGKPAVSAAVEALCRRGLVERHGVESDQRAVALRLTAEGEQTLARVEQDMRARVDAVLGRVPDPDAVVAALVDVGSALDELAAERVAQAESHCRPAATEAAR